MSGDGRGKHARRRASADYLVVAAAVVGGLVLLGSLLVAGGADPLTLAAGDGQEAANDRDPLNTTAVERAIAAAVNDERTARGRSSVEYEPGLATVARNHSVDMIARDYYAHVSPDGDAAFERVQSSSVSCSSVGENIAATWWQTTFETTDGERERHTTREELVDELLEQWLNSPDHRENMLSTQWERTGVGVAVTQDGEVLVTQNFCD
ncbi:CAP domain-containing protein [Halovenus halobia]|uniref:CAP domain-containing protein n=1 Tax=Halovenus halobia TaxID=3396622 RepID=UPI003F56E09B